MQNPRFVVLTGHLNDYPLADLVGILRHQKKTGRLLVEYPNGPAAFYFQEGELIDAQVDKLSGLQAICVALAKPNSPFNFNPLIAPTRRTVESSLQRVVSELVGCWDETPLQVETTIKQKPLPPEPLALPESTKADSETTALELLTFGGTAPTSRYTRIVLAMAAGGLMMLGISTVIAVTGGFSSTEPPKKATVAVAPEPRPQAKVKEEVQPVSPVEPQRVLAASQEQLQAAGGPSGQQRLRTNLKGRSVATAQSATPNETQSPVATKLSAEVNRSESVTASESVDVVMQIENGRVMHASIANPRKGMDGYEALALRIARQRRYPAKKSGQETVRIRVNPPN